MAELRSTRKQYRKERRRRKAWQGRAADYLDMVQRQSNKDAKRPAFSTTASVSATPEVWRGPGIFERAPVNSTPQESSEAMLQDDTWRDPDFCVCPNEPLNALHEPCTGDEATDAMLKAAWDHGGPDQVDALVAFWYRNGLHQIQYREEMQTERDQARIKANNAEHARMLAEGSYCELYSEYRQVVDNLMEQCRRGNNLEIELTATRRKVEARDGELRLVEAMGKSPYAGPERDLGDDDF
jgi:hypothetical protein